MEIIPKKLSEKDTRAIRIGVVAVAAIVLFVFVSNWFGHWADVRKSLAEKEAILKSLNPSKAKQAGLLSIVPAFEMPQAEEQQKFLFRDKLAEQLKKAGIKTRPLEILSAGKARGSGGYKMLRIKCGSDKCKLSQILDLLAALKENPYLVCVEELKIKCDPKKREEFKMGMTVSTFVK